MGTASRARGVPGCRRNGAPLDDGPAAVDRALPRRGAPPRRLRVGPVALCPDVAPAPPPATARPGHGLVGGREALAREGLRTRRHALACRARSRAADGRGAQLPPGRRPPTPRVART